MIVNWKGCESKQVSSNVRYYPACEVTEENYNKPVIIACYKVDICPWDGQHMEQ